MSGFCDEARQKAAEDELARAFAGAFAGAGYERIAPSVLQPADVFLDRLGDEVRSGIYMLTDPGGAELCLRPEITIPACLLYLQGDPDPKALARLYYDGPIYRYAAPGTGGRIEERQIGIECLGVTDKEAAETEVLALCLRALRAAGIGEIRLQLGDIGLFTALLAAIDLPEQWRGRLLRHFSRPERFARILRRLAGEGGVPASVGPLLKTLGRLSEDEARAVIEDVLAVADIRSLGVRGTAEITERLLEQAADASTLNMARESVALIETFVKISGPVQSAAQEIRTLTKAAGIDLGPALSMFERRLALLEAASVDLGTAKFATSSGRTLDYYSGFVFEVTSAQGDRLAAGGRYDSLLADLGAASPIPAIGGAIFCTGVLAASVL